MQELYFRQNLIKERKTENGRISTTKLKTIKNVAEEIFGAITVMKAARKLKLKRIKLYFDFSGIEDIALGKIKPKQKNRFLLAYRDFFTEINKYIKIDFCKVKSHSGIELNNKADRLAKQAVGLRKEV